MTWAEESLHSVEDLQADFDALYRGLQEAHFDLYVNMPKADISSPMMVLLLV